MKEIIIKGKSIRRELWILLGCFVFAVCVNIFAIIKYSRPAKELVTMIGYVFVVAIITPPQICNSPRWAILTYIRYYSLLLELTENACMIRFNCCSTIERSASVSLLMRVSIERAEEPSSDHPNSR